MHILPLDMDEKSKNVRATVENPFLLGLRFPLNGAKQLSIRFALDREIAC